MSKQNTIKKTPTIRCAIYTRKSTSDGLEQEYNTLDAQRDSGEAYIASQKGEGWVCIPDRYDDGGFTGGNMERPALKQLMEDIEAGKVDCVIVYKVDRMSRSLMDFARMMVTFEEKKVSFVSVTQQFNTTQSMGRLTLNILLSFAQFEREIISERTRDKIAAARRKGKRPSGRLVLGYDGDPVTKKLVINTKEAKLVREIFRMYLEKRSLLQVSQELNARGERTKFVQASTGMIYGGREWDKAAVQKILNNLLFRGRVRYKDEVYEGEHDAIVDDDLWTKVHKVLRHNGHRGGTNVNTKYGSLLGGLLNCAPCNSVMGHTTTGKKKKQVYRYYVCYRAQKQGWDVCPCGSLPADQIESFVVDQIRRIGNDPALRSLTLAKCREQMESQRLADENELSGVERDLARLGRELSQTAGDADSNPYASARLADINEKMRVAEEQAADLQHQIDEACDGVISKEEVDAALGKFDGVWSSLSPKEQTKLIRMLIQRVDYDATKGDVSITFHPLGLKSIGQQACEEVVA